MYPWNPCKDTEAEQENKPCRVYRKGNKMMVAGSILVGWWKLGEMSWFRGEVGWLLVHFLYLCDYFKTSHLSIPLARIHCLSWLHRDPEVGRCLSKSSEQELMQQKWPSGLPWWRSGWESACQCRGHRFEPWSGKIPHAAEQLGPWATTTEPAHLEPVLCNKRGHDGERPAHRDEEWPLLAATRESPRTETKTQHSQK